MILIDTNLLIYAYDDASAFHQAARSWVEEVLSGAEPVRMTWSAVHGFLRLTTHTAVFRTPMSMLEAIEIVDDWLAQPSVAILEPGAGYWTILRKLLRGGIRGPLVMDAHLARSRSSKEQCSTRTIATFFGSKGCEPSIRWRSRRSWACQRIGVSRPLAAYRGENARSRLRNDPWPARPT
jgi:toxin-antitoxin system PIN domain toxin